MVVDVFISDILMLNGHDDVYLNKPTRRQSSICHLTRSVICTLPSRRLLGTVVAPWPGAFDVDRSVT